VTVSSNGIRLAGIHWVLTQVNHNGKPPVVIPTSTDANIEFHRDGTAEANDGVNGLDADYTATTTTITLHNPMVGAVGYSGGDPALDATTRSLGDLFDQGDA
jgi:heat shock protein HslJ